MHEEVDKMKNMKKKKWKVEKLMKEKWRIEMKLICVLTQLINKIKIKFYLISKINKIKNINKIKIFNTHSVCVRVCARARY